MFHEYQSHVLFFLKSQKWPFDNFCWAQDATVVVVNVCGLSQLCLCLKQHQAQLVNIPDMYLLSTLDDIIVISWFDNCYHKKNDVCFICFNIAKY